MRMMRAIEIVLGVVFVSSAALKSLDVTSFAIQVSYYGIVREPSVVLCVAYLAIGVEAVLGALLVSGNRLRGLTWGTALALLTGFTGLILYAWIFRDLEDCGCFGKFLKMTPGVSIVKNVILGGSLALPWWVYRHEVGVQIRNDAPRRRRHLRRVVGALSIAYVVCVGAYGSFSREVPASSGVTGARPVDKERPFAQFRAEDESQVHDLGEGEYLVAMLNTDCEHCQAAVDVLNDLALVPEFPTMVALMLGDEETLEAFREETNPEFPTVLIEPLTFFQFIGDAPPRLIHVRDGKQMRFWDEEELEFAALVEALLDTSREQMSGSTPY